MVLRLFAVRQADNQTVIGFFWAESIGSLGDMVETQSPIPTTVNTSWLIGRGYHGWIVWSPLQVLQPSYNYAAHVVWKMDRFW